VLKNAGIYMQQIPAVSMAGIEAANEIS